MSAITEALVVGSTSWNNYITQNSTESSDDFSSALSATSSSALSATSLLDTDTTEETEETETTSTSDSTTASSSDSFDVNEFIKYAKMSPAERIRYDYLKSQGLDEKSFAALPADQKQAIEDEIKKLIKEKLGLDSDGTTGAASTSA